MRVNCFRVALLGALAVALVTPVPAKAAVIVLDDIRMIEGSALASDYDNGLFVSQDYKTFSQTRPTSGAPWSASDAVLVASGAAAATSGATQSSYAGPTAFGGTGSATGTAATSGSNEDSAGGTARSDYYLLFMLTDVSYVFDYTAVVAATSAGFTDGSYGQSSASLEDYFSSTIAGANIAAQSFGGVPAADAAHVLGILPPGTYALLASAFAQTQNSPASTVGRSVSAGSSVNVNLTLTPVLDPVAVPEPGSLGLLSVGIAAWAAFRRRHRVRHPIP